MHIEDFKKAMSRVRLTTVPSSNYMAASQKITEDIELIRFDEVNEVAVYVGGLTNLAQVDIKWREEYGEISDKAYLTYVEKLKLSEITEQLKDYSMITIIIDKQYSCEIWQYGNHGKYWWRIGEICKYA